MIAGLLVLVLMVGGSLWLARDLAGGARESVRLLAYERSLTGLLLSFRRAEVGQRGYILTENLAYLDPYHVAVRDVPLEVAAIGRFGGARGKATVAALAPAIEAKLAELAETISEVGAGNRDRAIAIVETNRGKAMMDGIRARIEPERVRIRTLLDQTEARAAERAGALTVGLLLGLATMALLAFVWLSQTRRQFTAADIGRSAAETALAALRHESAQRERAEGDLRQLQKMETLGSLTGGIAHDFNNMLAVVIGGVELAKRNLTTHPERVARYLDTVQDGATRAAELTARLLAFSRKQPLAPVVVDANRLVTNMSEILHRTLGDDIAIETVLAGGLWKTYADVPQLENAIVNLAVNGRDAITGGGKLTIETANAHLDDRYAADHFEVAAGQYVAICVTDTGAGMSQAVIAKAFDPFFTTKEIGKGTGLGLSQVFGFVKQSGGHVGIYSELGEGTTVKLYLPRYMGEAAAQAAPTAGSDEIAMGQPSEIILVVEDEQRVRHFAVDVLREFGYTTISAGSSAEALRVLAEQPDIALLFTDIVMPGMDGRALAELAQRQRPELKVLFTTGYTRNSVVHNGKLDVGVAFLAKPYTIADMARKIRQVLDGEGVNRPV